MSTAILTSVGGLVLRSAGEIEQQIKRLEIAQQALKSDMKARQSEKQFLRFELRKINKAIKEQNAPIKTPRVEQHVLAAKLLKIILTNYPGSMRRCESLMQRSASHLGQIFHLACRRMRHPKHSAAMPAFRVWMMAQYEQHLDPFKPSILTDASAAVKKELLEYMVPYLEKNRY